MEVERRQQPRLVAADTRLGGQCVHRLGPGDAGDELDRDRGDLALGKLADQVEVPERAEEAEHHGSLAQAGDARWARRPDAQVDVCAGAPASA